MMMIGVGSAVDESMVGLEKGNMVGELNLADSGDNILGEPVNSWYVKAGATGGDGSEARPFGNLKDAYDNASAGDTIYVMNGTYTGSKNANLILSKENLQIKAFIDSNPIFKGFGNKHIFHLQNESIMISGLTFIDGIAYTGTPGGAILIDAANVVIDNCTFRDNQLQGLIHLQMVEQYMWLHQEPMQ